MTASTVRATARETVWLLEVKDESAIAGFAAKVAALAGPGDLVTLSGGLGAGKTAFARALIRMLTGEQDLEVPSPAFTLMQVYEGLNFPIVHADFYRIEKPRELVELGFEEACEGALVLVEWPERAGDFLGGDRLDIELRLDADRGPFYRAATLKGTGSFAGRLAHAKAVCEILDRSSWSGARREFLQGDASTRSYERLVKPDGQSALLMHSPPRSDGPPIRYGKPYSAIAKLAEDIRPFVAVDHALRAQGLSAPEILAFDLAAGLAIIEDLGCEPLTRGAGIIEERYAMALTALAHLHGASLPDTLPLDGESYRIPTYDIDALLIEVELLLDWYAPYIACIELASGAKATFANLWRQAVQDVLAARPTWTLRDYHSPNLLWLSEREGIAKVGVVDFQDCVLGHPAYDVVSLLQDARVDVPQEVELKLLAQYARLRREAEPGFDVAGLARAYAILGAQRATKILGIFARLDERDHKPQYLANLPRVEKYLAKNLCHPALADLKRWYEEHLPRIFGVAH
jgi:tRNA threonylcarbamoyl adenosine modification protein YjeE